MRFPFGKFGLVEQVLFDMYTLASLGLGDQDYDFFYDVYWTWSEAYENARLAELTT